MPKRRAASRWLSPSTWQAWRTRAYSSTAFILTLPAVRTGRKIRRRLFTPPPRPDTPAASVRDFLSAAYTQNRIVVSWLLEHSSRPRKAVELWILLFEHLHRDTGEIALTREELAAEIGETADNVSRLMTELEGIGAVSRRRERVPGLRGRGRVVYFMNPNVGTHLAGAARDKAQAEAPRLQLVE